MTAQLLTEHHLEYVSLKGGCPSSPESVHALLEITCRGSYVKKIVGKKKFTFKNCVYLDLDLLMA